MELNIKGEKQPFALLSIHSGIYLENIILVQTPVTFRKTTEFKLIQQVSLYYVCLHRVQAILNALLSVTDLFIQAILTGA